VVVEGVRGTCPHMSVEHTNTGCTGSTLSVMPIRTPEAWSWQHFVDGALPKLFAARRYLLEHPEVKIAIEASRSPNIDKVLELVGASSLTRVLAHKMKGCHGMSEARLLWHVLKPAAATTTESDYFKQHFTTLPCHTLTHRDTP
jgi:hypothetical protein